MRMFSLEGRRALVTGGGRGLGRAMAEALAAAGAETVVTGSSGAPERAAAEMRAAGLRVHPLNFDLGDRRALEAGYARATQLLGAPPDILVNNAGINIRHPAGEFPDEDLDRVMEINFAAVFRLSRLAGQAMLEHGWGRVINIASVLSFFGGITVPAYAASKGALAQLTKALSNEWAGRGVTVNAIAPGYMATEMNEALLADPDRNREISARIPAGRWGRPEDLAGITVFLASDASAYLSGAVIPVDGGYSAR